MTLPPAPEAVHVQAPAGARRPEVGAPLKPLGGAFIKWVKLAIAPVIFLTVASGQEVGWRRPSAEASTAPTSP